MPRRESLFMEGLLNSAIVLNPHQNLILQVRNFAGKEIAYQFKSKFTKLSQLSNTYLLNEDSMGMRGIVSALMEFRV